MADVSDRRREPKGIPAGGRFAREDGGRSDASDLEQGYFAEQRHTRGYEYPTDEKEEHPEAGLLADRPEKDWNNLRNTEDVKAIWDPEKLKATEGEYVDVPVCTPEEERAIIAKAVGTPERLGRLSAGFEKWVGDRSRCVELGYEEAERRQRQARRRCALDADKCYSAAYAQAVFSAQLHTETLLCRNYGLSDHKARFGKHFHKACEEWAREHGMQVPPPAERDRIWDEQLRAYAADKIKRGVKFGRGLCYTDGNRANPISRNEKPTTGPDGKPLNGRVDFEDMMTRFNRALNADRHEDLTDHLGRDEGTALNVSNAEGVDARRLYQTALEQNMPESKLKALRGMLGIDEEQAGRWAAEANAKRMLDSMSV